MIPLYSLTKFSSFTSPGAVKNEHFCLLRPFTYVPQKKAVVERKGINLRNLLFMRIFPIHNATFPIFPDERNKCFCVKQVSFLKKEMNTLA